MNLEQSQLKLVQMFLCLSRKWSVEEIGVSRRLLQGSCLLLRKRRGRLSTLSKKKDHWTPKIISSIKLDEKSTLQRWVTLLVKNTVLTNLKQLNVAGAIWCKENFHTRYQSRKAVSQWLKKIKGEGLKSAPNQLKNLTSLLRIWNSTKMSTRQQNLILSNLIWQNLLTSSSEGLLCRLKLKNLMSTYSIWERKAIKELCFLPQTPTQNFGQKFRKRL